MSDSPAWYKLQFANVPPRADGADGLHNVHDVHPHLSPSDAWKTLFKDSADGTAEDLGEYSKYFTPSKVPSHKEILRILRENPADTVSIIAIGPLTNMALAAADDPETFLKVKELVVMGGCVHVEGNVTPVAEFNCYADAVAAARVYALTSLIPASTLPPVPEDISVLAPYPTKLSRQLKLVLCPLDITNPHLISRSFFNDYLKPRIDAGSPLAQWTSHFVNGAFDKVASITGAGPNSSLELHDPLTVWYLLTRDDPKWKLVAKPEDIRVETSGQWTRGMHVIDRRNQSKPESIETVNPDEPVEAVGADATDEDEVPGDDMGWRSARKGNRISRVIATPGEEIFKEVLMQRVFG